MQAAVVTGGGTGIGRALALQLSTSGAKVLICGRRLPPLQEVASAAPNGLVDFVQADLSTEGGQRTLIDRTKQMHAEAPLTWLVHNAAIIGGVSKFESLDPSAFKQAQAVNVDAALVITHALLPELKQTRGRVMHISSGAAHSAMLGWTSYCVTKAALHMMYKCMAAELAPDGVAVGSVRPGVVDTEMQDLLRSSDPSDFPNLERFKELKKNAWQGGEAVHAPPDGGLDSAKNVSKFLHFLLTQTSAEEFSAEEWDIRDKSHHHRWITGSTV